MLHGVMGSFMLLGVGSIAGKILAWIGVGIIAVHTVLGVLLTVDTLKQSKNNGKLYLKENALFWTRRASGLAILIMVFFHIGLFGKVMDGQYILFEFTPAKLIVQLLLIAALFVHVFANIRPLFISLGIINNRERKADLFLVLSILVLFMAGSTVIYFIGWAQ
jgi:succinate dehydrogenase/fumarate reductase cytochrome b subunit